MVNEVVEYMLVSCNAVPQMRIVSPQAKTTPPPTFCVTIETNVVIYLSVALNLTVIKMVANLDIDFFKSSTVLHKIRKDPLQRRGCYFIPVIQITLEISLN